jgi:hypothetical protein
MRIKLKANIPEIIFGVFLTVSIFAMGMLFESSRKPPADNQSRQTANQSSAPVSPEYATDKATDWLLVFLNFFLVGSTLLLWRANNRSAKIAERALTGLERPRILSYTPSFAITEEEIKTQVFVINLGRDPGRIKKISVNFIDGDLPGVPDFSSATKTEEPDMWMLPASIYSQPRNGGIGFPFTHNKRAKFMAVKIMYEWDFGKHEHAFACTIVPYGTPPETVGGTAYNYDK